MSSHEQEQTEILETCQRINQVLQITEEQFSLEALTHIDWYMTVLEILYPQLQAKFEQIKQIENEAAAIDKLLLMLTQEQIIEEDFLQIKGHDIVQGDIQSVYYLVQLLSALIQREQQEEGDDQQQKQEKDQAQQQSEQGNRLAHSQRQYNHLQMEQGEGQNQEFSNDFEQPESLNCLPQQAQEQPFPAKNLPKPLFNDPTMFKNAFNHYDSQDQPSHQEERHSVLGIQNEFQDDNDEQQQKSQKVQQSSGSKQFGNSATFGQQKSQSGSLVQQQPLKAKQNQNQLPFYPTSNQSNNLISYQQKPQQELKATEYKMTQNEAPKKNFPSSSQEKLDNNQQLNKKPNKKPSKPQKSKEDSQEEDENQYFINPTIKKYKSDPKLMKKAVLGSKKSTTKKNLFKYTSPTIKHPKKLVSHPTIKKEYQKATNPQAKKLTQQIMAQTSVLIKKKQKPIQVVSTINPSTTEMQRKNREFKVKLKEWKKQSHIRSQLKFNSNTIKSQSNFKLGKLLNWREGQLKREKNEFEKAMQIKLQRQKQVYIKKINNLLIKLQMEKELHERQQYKEKLIHENQDAAKRLTAIQQWYKDRIQMLKQSNLSNKNERTLMHTGHKQILKQIEKELKRQNQKQIMALTMKYRRQQAQVENDLQELEREIIKVYKRH